MSRSEFGAVVRRQAFNRCDGFCEGKDCGAKLFPGKFAFDHIIPDGLGGEPTLENCQVLCSLCHNDKTVTLDRPIMAKADRQRKKHFGLGKDKCGFRKRPPGMTYDWSKGRYEKDAT